MCDADLGEDADLGVTTLLARVIVPNEALTGIFGCGLPSPALPPPEGGLGETLFAGPDPLGWITRCFVFLPKELLRARFAWVVVEEGGSASVDADGWGDLGLPLTLRDRSDRGIEWATFVVKKVGIVGDIGEDRDLGRGVEPSNTVDDCTLVTRRAGRGGGAVSGNNKGESVGGGGLAGDCSWLWLADTVPPDLFLRRG